MDTPNLMPNQFLPFNGDTNIEAEFLKLKEKFNIVQAVELGTCLGGTAVWLGKNFDRVTTIEINPSFAQIAQNKINENHLPNVSLFVGDTVTVLPSLTDITDRSLIFIDSHWQESCPMLQELYVIAKKGIKPVIAIHDFKVPNEPNLGFDEYKGQAFTFEWIKASLDAIYGEGGYDYHYNGDATSTEIKRGIIYIYPKVVPIEETVPVVSPDITPFAPARQDGKKENILSGTMDSTSFTNTVQREPAADIPNSLPASNEDGSVGILSEPMVEKISDFKDDNSAKTRIMTFGEKFIGAYNPSANPTIDRVTQICAELSDIVFDEFSNREVSNLDNIIKNHALGEILNAQMSVVKLLTFKY